MSLINQRKQILVLTPIYPADDIPKGWTPVVHYFAREWVKQGHHVLVVNYQARFPRVFYWITKLFGDIITSKVGYTIMTKAVEDRNYSIDGVNVCRICMKKYKPHGKYSQTVINKAFVQTIEYCKKTNFRPNAIVSHWSNPQLQLMYHLKKQFQVPTCYIAHSKEHFEEYGEKGRLYWASVDMVGYRSAAIKRNFETSSVFIKPSFMCYSGIPTLYNDNTVLRSFKEVKKVAFVGTLIKRKYPSQIIQALVDSIGNDFTISYAGEGQESVAIHAEAHRLNVEQNVRLLGRIERKEVIQLLDKCDLFIMISRSETFGLVYLEAMARGCITIASKDEGFDGIIKDGINGFLCEAGNSTELAEIIKKILSMDSEHRKAISNNAMETAKSLTEEKVAMDYLTYVFH